MTETQAGATLPNPNTIKTPEIEPNKHTAWMFDIDGVVTNPKTKQVEFPQITDFIAERLAKGEPVGLITGRALSTIMENVFPKIKAQVKDPAHLANLYVSGEFGGSSTTWKDGKEVHSVDPNIRVPQPMVDESVSAAQSFKDSQFVDEKKATMVSIEMNNGMEVDKFKPEQAKLVPKLQEIVKRLDPNGQFEVHVDRIATNVRDKRANKYYAAEQFVKWATSQGKKKPDLYIPLGDSLGDLEMGRQLKKMNLAQEFIFVGGPEHLQGETIDFPIKITTGHCDEGVVEYIKEYKAKTSKPA